jgi:hypothetical protein
MAKSCGGKMGCGPGNKKGGGGSMGMPVGGKKTKAKKKKK